MNTTRIIFDCPISPWLVAGGAGVILLVALFFAWRDTAKIGLTRRIVILCLLAIGAAILAAIAVSPRIIRTWRDPHKPQVAVVLDGSRSMLLTDRYTGEQARWLATNGNATPGNPGAEIEISRETVVRRLLAESASAVGWATKVSRQFEVTGFRFAGDVTAWPLAGDTPFAVDPEGYSTALGDVLDRVGRSVGAQGGSTDRPRAIVLVSDGAGNIGADPTEVARVLGRLGTPVYVVAVGDPNPPRDVAVLDVRVPKRLNLGEELVVSADIAVTGFGAARIPVELLRDGEVIDKREIVSGPSDRAGRPTVVNFSFVPDRPGSLRLTVRVPPQPGVQNPEHSEGSGVVEVDDRKIRVLMVDSEPRWQFRFLRNAMERDPAVASTLTLCLLRPGVGPIQGPGYITALPTDARQLGEYDVIILGDVERAKLPDEFCKSLAQMVRLRSTALMVMAGRKGHYRELADTPLGEILPVTLKQGSGGDPLEFTARGGAPYTVELTEIGRTHLLTRLASSVQENEAIWGRFVPLRWAAAVTGLAPGADSLLVHPDRLAGANKLPLLAVQQVGAGKVMFCGIDESWRWRREVGDKYFYRFWAQALRWMVKKPFSDSDPDSNKARLALDRTESDVGQVVQVEAYCLGPDGYPLQPAKDGKDAAQVCVRIEPAVAAGAAAANSANVKAEQIVLTPAPGGWGIYRGKFTAGKPGTYLLRPIVADYGSQPLNSPVKLTVTRADLERNFAGQDRVTLAAIAQASGGELLSIDQADRLADLLAARAESRTQTAEFSLTQHWACYAALAAVLAALWLIRKRAGLA